ncbi:MAG: endonuclease V [Deltaproteobacteria bacterium]|nr:endonuclease V [Candidatus Zymogenaceae bacterium]
MKIESLHSWDVDYQTARSIQEHLRGRLILTGGNSSFTLVAGADVSYNRGDDVFFASVVVMDLHTGAIVEKVHHHGCVTFPYIPGLLTFREGPVVLGAFEKLTVTPDVVIFDGQGIAHPRGLGLAAHLGLILDLPSAGCAKSRLVGEHGPVGWEKGSITPLMYEEKKVGAVLRTRTGVKPVFVSPGHRLDCMGAVDLVLSAVGKYRLPEPIRHAHTSVNTFRRELSGI